jgi:steroid delta-isomerase-like uncharacterized protein
MSTPTEEKNKGIVRRYFSEILSKGQYHVVEEIFAPKFFFMGPNTKKNKKEVTESIYEFAALLRRAFPDLNFAIENEIAEDNQVAVVWRFTGTHKKTFQKVKPSGKYVSITGIDIFYLENGSIEGMWAFFEMRSMLEQILVLNKNTKTRSSTPANGTAKKKRTQS